MTNEEWNLTIGEIVAPFSRFGEVKVRLETDFPERFSRLQQVCLRWPNGESRFMSIESARQHKGQILLKLRGIASINDAEGLRNTLVQVRAQDAVRLPPGEYYIHDLLGCEVVLANEQRLGILTDVRRTGANDVYTIRQENRQEILLPATREVVREVDLSRRRILVTPTPGLLPGEAEEI